MKKLGPSIFSALLLLNGCVAAPSKNQSNQYLETNVPVAIATKMFYQQKDVKGSNAVSLASNKITLVTSKTQGLLLLDHKGDLIRQLPGNFEGLSLRNDVKLGGIGHTLIASRNSETDDITLFSFNAINNELTQLTHLSAGKAPPDAFCFGRDNITQHISLYTIDAKGTVYEHIIYDGQRQQLVQQPIRQFVGVADAQSCAVDDATETLYIAEGSVGVWAFAANAEMDPSREPIDMVKPFGNLEGEVKDINVDSSGGVWVITPDTRTLHRYGADKEYNSYFLKGTGAPETVSVTLNTDGTAKLLVFDDDQDAYLQATITDQDFGNNTDAPARLPFVLADAETDPVGRFGDAADDPAIWLNEAKPGNSLILGTDKRAGLMVYGLDGHLLQSLEVGRVNNVDLRQHNTINNTSHTLITASNRTNNSISAFTVDQGTVVPIGEIKTSLSDVYGLCQYQSNTGSYVFINDKDGRYQQFQITAVSPHIEAKLVGEFSLPSQPEGCAADDLSNTLYMGEEDQGIWKISAEPNPKRTPELIKKVGDVLKDDVEGIDIYHGTDKSYLVVSSQGNNSYVIYGLWGNYPLLTNFRVGMNLEKGIDGTSETDGLTVTSSPLPGYPKGLLIVQDGHNRMPDQPQNFKLIDWREIQKLMPE